MNSWVSNFSYNRKRITNNGEKRGEVARYENPKKQKVKMEKICVEMMCKRVLLAKMINKIILHIVQEEHGMSY